MNAKFLALVAVLGCSGWVQAQAPVAPRSQDYVDLWKLYQDSAVSDPRIRGAEAQVKNLEGQERAAFGQVLPQLSGGASTSRVRREEGMQTLNYNGESYNLTLSQALYNAAAWRGFKRYEQLTEQYRAQYEDAKTQSAADLVQRYFAALAAEDTLELVTAERKATQRNRLRRLELARGCVTLPSLATKPPVGFEPTTCGLQNRCSAN